MLKPYSFDRDVTGNAVNIYLPRHGFSLETPNTELTRQNLKNWAAYSFGALKSIYEQALL